MAATAVVLGPGMRYRAEMVRRALSIGLVLALAAGPAAAAPPPADGSGAAATPAGASAAPAAKRAPVPTTAAAAPAPRDPEAPVALRLTAAPRHDHRLLTAAGLGGVYLTVGTWAYFAWYYNHPNLPGFKVGGDGWFGDTTYAGGSDKLGHAWGNLALSRLTTDLLRAGGWGKVSSSVIASSLCFSFFFFVEVKDGFYYEFSPGDLAGDAAGALLSIAMTNWPALDDAIDFRVQWFPSIGYRRDLTSNFVEDYSGQTYVLAFKPGSLRAVRDSKYLRWMSYVDPVIGFDSHNFKPTPPDADMVPQWQRLFVGVSLDMQAVLDDAFHGHRSRGARIGQGITHRVFELGNLPYTTLPVVSAKRSASPYPIP
jgi:Predicted periplasmic lipoprotein (DUF2279)